MYKVTRKELEIAPPEDLYMGTQIHRTIISNGKDNVVISTIKGPVIRLFDSLLGIPYFYHECMAFWSDEKGKAVNWEEVDVERTDDPDAHETIHEIVCARITEKLEEENET